MTSDTERGSGAAGPGGPRKHSRTGLTRAAFLRLAGAGLAGLPGSGLVLGQEEKASDRMQTRPIPSSGEQLPLIGCGTYVGFDVGTDDAARGRLSGVLQALFEAGG